MNQECFDEFKELLKKHGYSGTIEVTDYRKGTKVWGAIGKPSVDDVSITLVINEWTFVDTTKEV